MNTGNILKGYAAIVESLALFDPSFVLVHRVCRTIRDYIKYFCYFYNCYINF